MKKSKLFLSIFSLFALTSCSSTNNSSSVIDSTSNSTSTSSSSSLSEQAPSEEFLENFPFSEFFFEANFNKKFDFRRQNAQFNKEIFEDVEMETKSDLYGTEGFLEGDEITDRDYSNTYIHWIEHCNNHIYTEITYPENFDASKQYTTVIMAHGFQSATPTYIPFINQMHNEDYIYIAFDFRGISEFSKSDGSLLETTLDTMVGDLKAVTSYAQSLPFVNNENLYLIGHSLGAVVSTIAMTSIYFENAYKAVTLLAPAFSIISYYTEMFEMDSLPETTSLYGYDVSKEFLESLFRHEHLIEDTMFYKNKVLMYVDVDDPLIYNDDNYQFAETFSFCDVYTLDGPDHFFIKEESMETIISGILNLIKTTEEK